MRNLFRNFAAAAGLALSVLAVVSLSTVSFAQAPIGGRSFPSRMFQTEQTHYLRFAINFNSCVPASLTCTFKVGSVPYNSFMVRAFTQTYTTFTGATTATVSFGTTSTAAVNLMAATTILTAGNAIAQTVAAGGLGTTVTGNGIAQTGTLGGFDIYATIVYTVANATAGSAVGILEYIAPNDGSCAPVPLAATAVGC